MFGNSFNFGNRPDDLGSDDGDECRVAGFGEEVFGGEAGREAGFGFGGSYTCRFLFGKYFRRGRWGPRK